MVELVGGGSVINGATPSNYSPGFMLNHVVPFLQSYIRKEGRWKKNLLSCSSSAVLRFRYCPYKYNLKRYGLDTSGWIEYHTPDFATPRGYNIFLFNIFVALLQKPYKWYKDCQVLCFHWKLSIISCHW